MRSKRSGRMDNRWYYETTTLITGQRIVNSRVRNGWTENRIMIVSFRLNSS